MKNLFSYSSKHKFYHLPFSFPPFLSEIQNIFYISVGKKIIKKYLCHFIMLTRVKFIVF